MALNSIGKVDSVEAAAQARAAEAAYSPVRGAAAAGDAAAVAAAQPQVAKPAAPAPARYPDVRLKFMVDTETRDVTVLVLDRASQRVIRTIPPDEMAHLNEGDILELFA